MSEIDSTVINADRRQEYINFIKYLRDFSYTMFFKDDCFSVNKIHGGDDTILDSLFIQYIDYLDKTLETHEVLLDSELEIIKNEFKKEN